MGWNEYWYQHKCTCRLFKHRTEMESVDISSSGKGALNSLRPQTIYKVQLVIVTRATFGENGKKSKYGDIATFNSTWEVEVLDDGKLKFRKEPKDQSTDTRFKIKKLDVDFSVSPWHTELKVSRQPSSVVATVLWRTHPDIKDHDPFKKFTCELGVQIPKKPRLRPVTFYVGPYATNKADPTKIKRGGGLVDYLEFRKRVNALPANVKGQLRDVNGELQAVFTGYADTRGKIDKNDNLGKKRAENLMKKFVDLAGAKKVNCVPITKGEGFKSATDVGAKEANVPMARIVHVEIVKKAGQ